MMNQRGGQYPMRQFYLDGGSGHHPGGLGWVIFALLLLLILLMFVQLALTLMRPRFGGPGKFRHRGGPPGFGWGGGPDAAAIARIRYARGEISREEYSQLVDDLGGPTGPPHGPPPPPPPD
jgi:uncharacterized membrane protein